MHRISLIFILTIATLACSNDSEIEVSIKLHDPEHHEQFVKALKENGIQFQISKDSQVFYLASKQVEVQEIVNSIIGKPDPNIKGAIVGTTQATEIASKLREAGIFFEVINQAETSTFTWATEDNNQAFEIVQKVLKAHGV